MGAKKKVDAIVAVRESQEMKLLGVQRSFLESVGYMIESNS